MKRIDVKVHGARHKAVSLQCPKCGYFEFEERSARKVIEELREAPLKIKQKIVKLSQDRLGIYFNKNVVGSLSLKKGDEIFVSVPDKKHIILELS